MSGLEAAAPKAASGTTKTHAALLDAYREGLGLAAVAAIRGPKGVRVVAGETLGGRCIIPPGEMLDGVWWCRRIDHAQRLVTAVMTPARCAAAPRLLRPSITRTDLIVRLAAAVRRLGIALYSDEEITAAGACVIARVDEEIAVLQRCGGFKSVNQSYRSYRLEAVSRGETARAYTEWLNTYKAKLVREIAATSRLF
jgi:hypothetical protein